MKKRPCTKHEGDFRTFGKMPYDFEFYCTKNKPPLFGGGSSCILKNVESNFIEFRFNIIWRGSAWPGSTATRRPHSDSSERDSRHPVRIAYNVNKGH